MVLRWPEESFEVGKTCKRRHALKLVLLLGTPVRSLSVVGHSEQGASLSPYPADRQVDGIYRQTAQLGLRADKAFSPLGFAANCSQRWNIGSTIHVSVIRRRAKRKMRSRR